MITKSDWDTWKSDPVTKAFLEACVQRVEDSKEILAVDAGINPDNDNFMRGFIHAYREIQNFSVEEVNDD